MVPFRVTAWFDASSLRLTTDSAIDTKPTRTLGATSQDVGAQLFHHGVISTVGCRLNPANAVTYKLEVLQSNDGASASYQNRSQHLFHSWDHAAITVGVVADLVDDVSYRWEGLDIPFFLEDIGDFWFNIDWSGAPGNTLGYIFIGGMREA
jgi:hypothetical protein